MKIYITRHRKNDTLIREWCFQNKAEDYEKWDFSNGSKFVLPKGKFLLFFSVWLLQDITDISKFVDDINNSQGYVVLQSGLEAVLKLEQFDLLDKLSDRLIIANDGFDHLPHSIPNRAGSFALMNIGEGIEQRPVMNTERTNSYLLFLNLKQKDMYRNLLHRQLVEQDLLKTQIGKIHTFNKEDLYKTPYEIFDGLQQWWCGNREPGYVIPWKHLDSVGYNLSVEVAFSCITEKTLKPMITEVPFITLHVRSNYYNVLKSYGFEIFDDIVDMSWHNKPLQERVDGLCSIVKDLQYNELDFYHASRKQCEHNYYQIFTHLARCRRETYQALNQLLVSVSA